MAVWEFDVAVSTHDLMRQGVTTAHWRRVTVAHDDHTTAALIACQMAAHDGAMPTDCLWRY